MLHDQRLFNLIRGPNLVLKPKNDEKTEKVVSHLVCITEGKKYYHPKTINNSLN